MIKDLFASGSSLLSFEVFPPKKDNEFAGVFSTIDELAALNPDFISVTYGAGGSNSKKTLEVASYIQNEKKRTIIKHIKDIWKRKKKRTQNLWPEEKKHIKSHKQNIRPGSVLK